MYKWFIFFILETLACNSDPCQNGATCFDHNGGGGYVCLCPSGFEGTNCENGKVSISHRSEPENDMTYFLKAFSLSYVHVFSKFNACMITRAEL